MNRHSYRKAVLKVEKKCCFYIHLTIYIVVNLFLFLINLFTLPQKWWFYWPLLGWGIGIFFHFINTISPLQKWIWRWKKEEIRKILEKEKK